MGLKRRLLIASSPVFEKGRNFCKQVGAEPTPRRGRGNEDLRHFYTDFGEESS